MKAIIINLEDQVLGSWHLITVEMDATDITIRLDGTILPPTFELHRRILMTLQAWEDELEGVTDKEAML